MTARLLAAAVVLTAAGPAGVAAQSTEVARTRHLRIHSDPWLNLHHFLYQWARAEEDIGSGRQDVPVPERGDEDHLGDRQREAWRAAVDFYREHLAGLDHFDGVMLRATNALWRKGPERALPDEPAGLARRLETAMEVYRERWWPGHDRANRSWWDAIEPWVADHEPFVVATMERAYGGRWEEPLRVDVSAYANWQGGYTSLRPDHTVVSSTDPSNQGLAGLEILVHEAGHQLALYGPNRGDVADTFAAAGIEPPRNLWHAVIFETAGWIVREVAGKEGLPDYEPMAEALREFRGWRELWPALDAHWVPFLEGDSSREEALSALATRFSEGED